jgi:dienelactone hydrolase
MIEQILEIPAAGTTEALLVRPDSKEPVPAFIQLTDIFGLRPAFAEQATGIAERGYVVLTPNMFYRTSKVPVFSFGPDFRNEQTRDRSRELSNPLATRVPWSATDRRTLISWRRSPSSPGDRLAPSSPPSPIQRAVPPIGVPTRIAVIHVMSTSCR